MESIYTPDDLLPGIFEETLVIEVIKCRAEAGRYHRFLDTSDMAEVTLERRRDALKINRLAVLATETLARLGEKVTH